MTIRIDGTNTTANPGITGGDADTGLQFGTDEVKIVTGGSDRALVDSSGYLRLAGGGLQFNGDTAAANALDDYEEGNWTPEYTASATSPTFTYGIQLGVYTKIGNLVTVGWRIRTDSASGGSGDIYITNLPFTIGNTDFDQRGVAAIWSNSWNAGGNPNHCNGRKGEDKIQLSVWGLIGDNSGTGGESQLVTVSALSNSISSNQTYGTFTYFVD